MYVYNVRFISKYFYINANSAFEMLKGVISPEGAYQSPLRGFKSYAIVAPRRGFIGRPPEGALKAMQ